MARNRMIKPEFWSSNTLNRVSLESRLTFIGMWNFADDYGVLLNSSRRILGDIYPLDESMTEKKIDNQKQELIGVGLLVPTEHEGQDFLIIKGWEEHQTVPNRSKRYHIEPTQIKPYLESNESLIRSDLSKEQRTKVKNKVERAKSKEQSTYGEDFEFFWKQTVFPKRPQDTKGDMKKKYATCRNSGLTQENILFACQIFEETNRGNEFAIGMRKFLNPDTVKEYLTEDVTLKDQKAQGAQKLRELEARLEQERIEEYGDLNGTSFPGLPQ